MFYILLFDLTFAGAGMPLTLLFVLLFLVPSMNDCFALFTGMACGKHKLSPQISPKKTIEGSVGGLVAAVVFAVLLPSLVCLCYGADASALAPLWYYALFGLMAGALAQIGDLAASLVKRDCGIKDFGKIFPGTRRRHGPAGRHTLCHAGLLRVFPDDGMTGLCNERSPYWARPARSARRRWTSRAAIRSAFGSSA